MDAFSLVFSLFGLLLGLSLAEVLGGFGRALRNRRVVHLGWLTSLLAIFVMFDLTSFWGWAWQARTYITPHYYVLLIGLVVSSLYYLAASIVFPAEFGDHTDFDSHYMQHRRQVLGAVVLCNVVGQGWTIIAFASTVRTDKWIGLALYYLFLATAIITSRKKLSIALLAGLICIYLEGAVASAILPR
jgi:hypothetical protein